MADDLNFEKMSTVQSNLQPGPVTIVAAATVAPTTFLTQLTGTVAIATITPPVSGSHMLALNPAATGTTVTTGNIALASTFVVNKVMLMVYDPNTAKYYPSY